MPALSRPQLAAYALAAVVVVVLGMRFMQGQARGGAAPASSGAQVARAPASVKIERPASTGALVHVAGAVRRPGVYRLRDGQRVEDAVERAGGARASADVNAINLAAKVADGQQVVVPRRGVAGAGGASAASAASDATGGAAPAPVSLNSATAEQLDTLDGVGPATAQKILDWRREHGSFRSIDDLGEVPGIGPKRLAALRDKVQL
jgi:competence protein ComEA